MKHLRITTLALALICGLSLMLAQDYKAGVLYGLTGPVKSAKIKSPNKLTKRFGKVKLTQDGKPKYNLFTYNEAGYPIAIGSDLPGLDINFKITYNDDQLPDMISFDLDKNRHVDIDYIYVGDRLASQVWKTAAKTITYDYSAEQYDPQGNWISRLVKETVVTDGGKPEVQEYTETREIKYY